MRILAVDDEKLALASIADAIKEASPEAELFTFQSPKEVQRHLELFVGSTCQVTVGQRLHWQVYYFKSSR